MKIVWGVDFSRDSKAAIRFFSGIDFPKGSKGVFLHVMTKNEELIKLAHTTNLTSQLDQLQKKVLQRAGRNLQKLADQFMSEQLHRSILIKEGNPGEEILSVLKKEQADLAVLGTRGVSGIKRFLLGSVSDWVVQEAPCSILVARGSGLRGNRGMRVVVATDGSSEADAAVEFLNLFVFPPNSEIVLFHVIEPTDYTVVQDDFRILGLGHSGLQELQKWAKDIHRKREQAQASLLQKTRKTLSRRKMKVEKIAVGYAAEEIIKTAYRFGADLIVMGSRGLTGVKRTLLGSVSSRVARHAPCSVLVVRRSQKRSRLHV